MLLQEPIEFLDTLPKQPEVGDEYFLQIGKCTHTLRVGSTSDIDRLISQDKEQPVEGLEEDLGKEIEKCLKQYNMLAVGKKDFTDIARHFAEWGAQHLKK